MKKRLSFAATCIYCDQRPSDAADHVPPKLLFPRPRPHNLITVPCCSACNQGFQQDDEYFQAMMLLRSDIAEQPEAKALMEGFYRSWERPRGTRFARSVANTFQIAEWHTPAGLFVGRSPAFEVDNKRMRRIYARITRGLFFHEQGVRVPDDYRVEVTLWVEEKPKVMETIPRMLGGREPKKIGGIFVYKWARAVENPLTSIWLMQFYRRALALAHVFPERMADGSI